MGYARAVCLAICRSACSRLGDKGVAVVALLCLAGWLRWQVVTRVQPYPDEFVTLLAVKMILQKGLPILPSGLFYEHGFLFSCAGAAASALVGFSREAVRGAGLLFGLLTVGLAWRVGRRWFSPGVGLIAAAALSVAPSAVVWGGRARMYTLLQVWVLLAVTLGLAGAIEGRRLRRWLALLCFLGAALTHFVSVALAPPLLAGMLLVGWLQARRAGRRPWFARDRSVWLEATGWAVVVLVALLVKRLGQPQSIAPLEVSAQGVLGGLGQVITIYGAFSTDLADSWRAVAAFFTAPEAIWLFVLAWVAVGWAVVHLIRRRLAERDLAALWMTWLLGSTTLEMVLLVAPERRDDKYLFMLLPLLALLGADGLARLGGLLWRGMWRVSGWHGDKGRHGVLRIAAVVPSRSVRKGAAGAACLIIVLTMWPAAAATFEHSGADYDAAFAYVREHWRDGDAVLTGTPAAAAIYLGRNDYYAMQDPGYTYRVLQKEGQMVDRWMGSPWLTTDEQLHATLSTSRRVWLVLERWGLTGEYYAPLTMQRILAMTDFVREDNGIIVLRSRQGGSLVPEEPPHPTSVDFDNQVTLQGYAIAQVGDGPANEMELILYWQAQRHLTQDYTVFVHMRDGSGRTVAQSDHMPLAPVYPPTLWPPGQTIRDRSVLALPEGWPVGERSEYSLAVGLYRLDTLERLPISGGIVRRDGENAVVLPVDEPN